MATRHGVNIIHEVSSLTMFRGQQLAIWIHDAEPGYSGKRMESLHISISPTGEMLVEKSPGLIVQNYDEYSTAEQWVADEYVSTVNS